LTANRSSDVLSVLAEANRIWSEHKPIGMTPSAVLIALQVAELRQMRSVAAPGQTPIAWRERCPVTMRWNYFDGPIRPEKVKGREQQALYAAPKAERDDQ